MTSHTTPETRMMSAFLIAGDRRTRGLIIEDAGDTITVTTQPTHQGDLRPEEMLTVAPEHEYYPFLR